MVDLRSGALVREELLLRMVSGAGVVEPPSTFLPDAERTGAITVLDRLVVRVAAAAAARGRRVAVNLSARSVSDPAFLDVVERAVAHAHIDPGQIAFELTETSPIESMHDAWIFADRVTALGCPFALDDAGTGYGGLTYLQTLPFTALKIDIRFVRDLATSRASRAIVGGLVHLAGELGLATIAEGIEDQRTLEIARDLGVDHGQGFHIGRPVPLLPALPPDHPVYGSRGERSSDSDCFDRAVRRSIASARWIGAML
jgi:EAL domain-containing protein (putative c-di-GMP-specific phosphodiesterase class I)